MTIKILLPVDGSECSLRAVDHFVAHAGWFNGVPEVHLLHVHPPIPLGRVQAHIGKETLHAYYQEEGEAQLAEAVRRLDAAELAFTQHIHVGQPAEVIAKLAGELGCDLILLGAHGRGAVAGLVTGSVTARVLHLAPCPVLVVR